MRVLLDTHALLWWAVNDPRLSKKAVATLGSFDTEVFVSAASAWEVATKFRMGKLPDADRMAQDFSARIERLGFRELPITVAHGQRAGLLPGSHRVPGSHRDPFDRMLIAQAQAEDLPMVSNEEIFDEYHVRRIW